MLANKLMGGSADKLYVDDMFSTYLYTGNGSTQAINNGIDLAGKGGLVWTKDRNNTYQHCLFDTVRVSGENDSYLDVSSTYAQTPYSTNSISYTATGYTLNNSLAYTNGVGQSYASWTFRKAPKFFDIVTYTGNGVAGRQIPHGLGIAPGMITTKSTSTTGDWNTYHRSAAGDLKLNLPDAQTASRALVTAASDSTFTVSGVANTSGVTYIAYLFAHDPSEDGMIQCGVTTANTPVNLGWEPQYLLFKNAANTYEGWIIYDSMRGLRVVGSNPLLYADASNAENTYRTVSPSATGFTVDGALFYLAIRRPNKPPTSGVEVYNAQAFLNNPGTNRVVGFPVDLVLSKIRSDLAESVSFEDRLRGLAKSDGSGFPKLKSASARAELIEEISTTYEGTGSNSRKDGSYEGGYMVVRSFFRRATGFFDIVCYTGTGVTRTVPHGLGVEPELMIVKSRSSGSLGWAVYPNDPAKYGMLNSSAGFYNDNTGVVWNSLAPTATHFSVGNGENIVNSTGATFVAYLFASLPGISKVGSYTGNGTSQTIPCGFTTGARFVLVKRTDSTGHWMIADTARGIVAAADPRLSLNTTDPEVTGEDWLDPDPTGFIVNQVADSNANVSGASYIFLAIA